ncbi:MAG: radical SAM protein [Elusimicrobiales bacterium]|nr:radical SAM protein [Elusimicrobiales bacterium]
MQIKDCVLKRSQDGIWLYHTASGYKVKMNQEALDVLEAMAARLGAAEMTEKEKLIYDKLAAKGIAGEDTGREEDRRIFLREKSRLSSVDLEFSGRCNLSCAHCFAALSQKDMSRETLEKVFAGIDALEPVSLTINGGEPLLNPLLPEALRQARARRLRVTVMSNATLATEETAGLLKDNAVAKVLVSLDFFEETHDAIRGSGAFKRAVRGIKFFIARKLPVFISAVVQESTAGRLEEFKNFCLGELGASGIKFSAVMPIGSAKDSPKLGLSAAKTKELYNDGLIPAPGDGDGVIARLAEGRKLYCKAGVNQCFISADGQVYACHYFQNIGESMGSLADRSLETIYREYQDGRAVPVDLDWNKLEKCKACVHFAKCMGGCRARAKILTRSWHDPDPFSCGIYGVE